ncbi:hypothetical protein RJP21_00060 [Paenibacillus sp. VCA1]|nr:hypothetical protein [Paenibacillus sp. VCA1]MDR9851988.1 hypothetical protein [Paenibacillus sp. VCA1]
MNAMPANWSGTGQPLPVSQRVFYRFNQYKKPPIWAAFRFQAYRLD